ncbi:hypothetical protein FBU31_000358 [Coemansia sp. 'formosensis']|nr:hypothetical protein FBU31_000358 [Coemansia sp. 'formosensis']
MIAKKEELQRRYQEYKLQGEARLGRNREEEEKKHSRQLKNQEKLLQQQKQKEHKKLLRQQKCQERLRQQQLPDHEISQEERERREREKIRVQQERERKEREEQEMAQVRLEKERKARVYLRRRQAIVERRKRMPELALSRTNIPAPASSSNSVLQLVFDYLSPAPGPRCTSKELLSHLRRIQRVAAVNREWRAVALPLFYCTVHIVISHSLETTDTDDSDGSDDDDKGQECEDDNMDEDGNEELLSTVGLSRNGAGMGLSTNIDLLCSADGIDKARKVQIIVQGMGQTAGQLLCQLVLAGVGKYE